jgi:GDPmannose 4,6-dehydratase
VKAMYLMMQQDEPEDFVIATGKTTSVRDMIKMAFSEVGVELEFKGEGKTEIGIIKSLSGEFEKNLKVGTTIVKVDASYFRPTEVDLLIGDPTKANTKLGWKPEYTLETLIQEMVQSDVKLMQKDKFLKDSGYEIKNYFE